jgi:hypothetical protein
MHSKILDLCQVLTGVLIFIVKPMHAGALFQEEDMMVIIFADQYNLIAIDFYP